MPRVTRHDPSIGPARILVLACFLVSGASGLIYQVVWMRELTLVFGATTLAVSTVLAVFMGGLAAGSAVGGRLANRSSRPLALYSWLELAIGLYGVVVPLLFAALPSVYQPLWQSAGLSFIALSLVRFALAAIVLAVPTFIMGATLPVLSRYAAESTLTVGRDVGSLYTVNTVGAVIGSAIAGLVLIPLAGLFGTTIVAASGNIVAAVIAFGLARRDRAAAGDGRADAPAMKAAHVERDAKRIALFAAFAVSGTAALIYEVAWTRALSLVIGSSVYAFAIMLTTFLAGLAAGSAIGTRIADRVRRPLAVLAGVEILVALAAFAGLFLIRELPFLYIVLFRQFDSSASGLLLATRLLLAAAVMIVPTTLLGAIFPLAVRSAARRIDEIGGTVGSLYSINTLGAIAGAFLTGFVLVPELGVKGSIVTAVLLNLGAAMILVPAIDGLATAARATCAAVIVALAAGSVASQPVWDPTVMASGVYRYAPSFKSATRQEFYRHFSEGGDGETVFYRDGVSATVAVQQQHGHFVLKVNGKPDATTAGDLPTQSLIAHIPLLLHNNPRNVLVVGWGSGVTVGAALTHPVDRVTAVELEPAVIEASHFFDGVNGKPLEDKRVNLLVNDGRNYLAATDERFDVIVSEPSNPWLSGVANLFTREYFQAGAAHLQPGGLFCQWLQIYEMQTTEVATLVGTFSDSFPAVYVFRGASGDLILVGSREPFAIDPTEIAVRINASQTIGDSLARVGAASPASILSRLYLAPDAAREFGGAAPRNTDDNARIEFLAPRRVGLSNEVTEQSNVDALNKGSEPLARWIVNPTSDLFNSMAIESIARGDKARAALFLRESLALGDTARAHSILGEIAAASGFDEEALTQWTRAVALDPSDLATNLDLGKYYLGKNNVDGALDRLDRAVASAPDSSRALHLRGLALQAKERYADALADLGRAAQDQDYARSVPAVTLNYGRALADVGRYDEALVQVSAYAEKEPRDPLGFYEVAHVEAILGDQSQDAAHYTRAERALVTALTIDPAFAEAHRDLSLVYRKLGRMDEAELEFDAFQRYAGGSR